MKLKHTLSAAALTLLASFSFAKTIQSVDNIVAVVGHAVITEKDLHATLADIQKQRAGQKINETEWLEWRRAALVELVNRTLIIEAGKQRGITASEAEIDQAIDSLAKQKKLSVEQLYAQANKAGKNKTAYRRELADALIAQKVQQQFIMQQARVSEAEVDAAFQQAKAQGANIPLSEPVKQYRAQHILIRVDKPEAEAAAKASIHKIWQQALNGTDFASLARTHSQDGSAQQGGDLGWFGDGVMVSEFENAVHNLKVGSISKPIQTQFGWHIIKLNEIRENSSSEDRQRSTIRQHLEAEKSQFAAQQLLKQLYESSFIDIRAR